jgi:hypothetical protein
VLTIRKRFVIPTRNKAIEPMTVPDTNPDMVDTHKLSVTLPEKSVEYLRKQYPDAKSDSERIAMAIYDSRKLNRLVEQQRYVQPIGESDE